MVYGFFNLKDKVKRYFRFSKEEIKNLIIVILVISFIISFKEWGPDEQTFDVWIGLKNLFISILIVGLSVIVGQVGHKVAALDAGHIAEFRIWIYGLILGVILVLITKGNVWFIAPGGIVLYHMTRHRLGYFRYGINMKVLGVVNLMGPMTNILIGAFVKSVGLYIPFIPLNAALIDKIFVFNIVYAAYSLLPIPPLPGSNIFFWSRGWYVFIAGFVVSYAIMVKFFAFYSFIWALLAGGVIFIVFYTVFEKKWVVE